MYSSPLSSPPSPHTNENVPGYHTMSLSRLYCMFFVIDIGLSNTSFPFLTKEGCILILFCGVGKSKLFISLPLLCEIKEKS